MSLLTEAQLDEMYERCVQLLGTNGAQVHHEEALRMCAAAGAEVDTASETVKFPRAVVEAALKSAPSRVSVRGVSVPDDSGLPIAETSAGATLYQDPLTGEHREATCADVRDYARLQEVLPEHSITAYPFPCDVPSATTDIHALRHHLANTNKPTVLLPLEVASVEYLFEILKVVWGDTAALKANPPATIINSMASPFVFKAIDVETIRQAGIHGIPVHLATCTMAAVSSPVTVAGHIAVTAAEILASIVLAQIMSPGTPCISDPMTSKLDMATGAAYLSGVEDLLCCAAVVELSKHRFGVPAASKMETDSCSQDEQAAAEKMLACHMLAQSGCDLLIGLGSVASVMGVSPLQAIMDDAFITIVRRAAAGIEINDNTLALDDIMEVGPGGTFLQRKHTRKNYRDVVRTDIFNRHPISGWQAAGGPTAVDKAREKYQAMERSEEPVLSEDTLKELDLVLARADEALAR